MSIVNDPVIYSDIEDIVSINNLFYTHGIDVHALSSVILMSYKMRPNTVYIYVVYDKDTANALLQQELNARTDVTGVKLVEKYNSTTEEIFACSCFDDESVLPREKFNLGISFVFIIKKLINPLLKF